MSFAPLINTRFRFCELHDALHRFLFPFRDYIDPLLDSNGYEPFVATLCIGILCSTKIQPSFLFAILDAYIVTVKECARRRVKVYCGKTGVEVGWWAWLFSRRVSRAELSQELKARVRPFVGKFTSTSTSTCPPLASDFGKLQLETNILFNAGLSHSSAFHEHYILYLSIIIAAYERFMDTETLIRAVENLVEFHTTEGNFYDNFDSNVVFEF